MCTAVSVFSHLPPPFISPRRPQLISSSSLWTCSIFLWYRLPHTASISLHRRHISTLGGAGFTPPITNSHLPTWACPPLTFDYHWVLTLPNKTSEKDKAGIIMIATIADIITDTITADTNIINTAANEGAVYHPPPPLSWCPSWCDAWGTCPCCPPSPSIGPAYLYRL